MSGGSTGSPATSASTACRAVRAIDPIFTTTALITDPTTPSNEGAAGVTSAATGACTMLMGEANLAETD